MRASHRLVPRMRRLARNEHNRIAAWPQQFPLRENKGSQYSLLRESRRDVNGVSMLYRLGRLLQLMGLLILPAAIAGEMAQKLDLKQSLAMSAVGVAVFFGGWIIQQGRKP